MHIDPIVFLLAADRAARAALSSNDASLATNPMWDAWGAGRIDRALNLARGITEGA